MNVDDELVDSYFRTRPNLDIPHDKFAILFLACSGSGKSTITALLVEKLGATFLRNDDIRRLYEERKLQRLPQPILRATWERMREQSRNQFIVFDSNMSASYMKHQSYLNILKKAGYKICIIALLLPPAELKRRIQSRKRADTEIVLDLLPAQLIAQQKALEVLVPDIVVTERDDPKAIVDQVAVLRQKLGVR